VALYPFTPIIFLVVFGWYLGNSVVHQFRDTMVGIVLALSGVPFYFFFRRMKHRETAS
jgi:hypothetical protein